MLYWNADPIAVSIGPLAIHWYGLLFAAAFLGGLQWMRLVYKREGRDQAELETLLGYLVVGVILGARLGHCLVYDPQYYLGNPLTILKIWEGGLASHGGVAGFVAAVWMFRRKSGRPGLLWLLDRLAIPAALGGGLVRLGNFMNSEIVGLPSTGPWAVVFVQVDHLPRHPVQLYEAAAYFAVFVVLALGYLAGRAALRPGFLSGWFLMLVFAARFGAEFFKTPQAAYEAEFLLTVGQWLSLPCVLFGLLLVVHGYRQSAVLRR